MYPENVAFPFGGEEFPEYVLMELHYDNPDKREGIAESPGGYEYTRIKKRHMHMPQQTAFVRVPLRS